MQKKRGRQPRRPRVEISPEDRRTALLESWKPKTELGKKVKAGEITSIEEVLNMSRRILESEIIDALIPNLESDYINIGQRKGKFGGGKRTIFRTTQKKTKDGNRPVFTVMAVVGNKDGYVGIGLGRAKETVPAREKAVRNAKLNIIQIARGNGSWESEVSEPNSIPFEVRGKSGSVEVRFMPAPPGTGLVIENELKKIFRLAGIQDVWSKSTGQTRQKINLVNATMQALGQTTKLKIREVQKPLVKYGSITQ
jgi:small subunit ribosomal protein S5